MYVTLTLTEHETPPPHIEPETGGFIKAYPKGTRASSAFIDTSDPADFDLKMQGLVSAARNTVISPKRTVDWK